MPPHLRNPLLLAWCAALVLHVCVIAIATNQSPRHESHANLDILSFQLRKDSSDTNGKTPTAGQSIPAKQSNSPETLTANDPNHFIPGNLVYLNTEETDTRAAPVTDWSLPSNMGSNMPKSIVFTVWVSAQGVIEVLELVEPELSYFDRTRIASALQSTEMAPATLQDVAVASMMTVELYLNPGELSP